MKVSSQDSGLSMVNVFNFLGKSAIDLVRGGMQEMIESMPKEIGKRFLRGIAAGNEHEVKRASVPA